MSHFNVQTITVAVLLAVVSSFSAAALTDSSAFAYKYEMDYLPWDAANVDLNNDGLRDWIQTSSSHFTLLDGILINTSATSGGIMSNDDNWAGIWPVASITAETGYQLELRVKITAWTAGTGAYKAQISPTGSALTDVFYINDDHLLWYVDGEDDILINTGDNTDDFHTFRIIRYPGESGKSSLYRDGVLVADMLDVTWTSSPRRCYLGDIDGAVSGQYELDYVRFDVPEPATMILFGLGGLILSGRQRFLRG